MRWNDNGESPDVIDRRGEGGGGGSSGGGLLSFIPILLQSKLGWIVLLIGGAIWLFSTLFGGSPSTTPPHSPTANGHAAQPAKAARSDDKDAHFAGFVLDDAQATWTKEFAARGKSYRHAKMVLFTDATQTACGAGQTATGPFYCPSDERVYIDLGFFKQLSSRFGAKGDFAQAYVVAHEIGHHVQKQLGISDRVHGSKTKGAEGSSVRLELQADCFAGVWAHSTDQRKLLDPGDVDEAMTAAQAVGDDRLQKQSGGAVRPESWTHGSSAERQRWFKRGFDTGKLEECDTFSSNDL